MRAKILDMWVDVVRWEEALALTLQWSAARESRYICHVNVHGAITARSDARFRDIVNAADLVAADGMPLTWVMRAQGFKHQPRLSGPDFMWRFCARAERLGLGIYLYGAGPETLRRLHERLLAAFPALRIVGFHSPPFRLLTDAECEEVAVRINASGAHAVFVALGCPKQERWMAEQVGRVQAVMFGVGAAFDYHAGSVRRAPAWMQASGMEWLHRLYTDPLRLWRRYLVTNSVFVALLAWQFLCHPLARKQNAS